MCIDEKMISSYLDGELEEPFKSQTLEHIEHCEACRSSYLRMQKLDTKMASDSLVTKSKDNNYSMLDSKYFSTNSKGVSILRRGFELKTYMLILIAVFILLVSTFSYSYSKKNNEVLYFDANINNDMKFVSNTSLDNFTLEEIIEYLNDLGYDVNLSIKGSTT